MFNEFSFVNLVDTYENYLTPNILLHEVFLRYVHVYSD